MNFDANTLSTLMQLLSAISPTNRGVCGDPVKPAQSEHARESGHSEYSGTTNRSANNGSSASTQSVFAMQNGLGEMSDLFGQQEKKAQSAPSSNPMSALLEMMTGSQSNGTDMMSSLMPMLMNMMSSKAKTANAQPSHTKAHPNKNADINAKYENTQKKNNDNSSDTYPTDRGACGDNKKTQPLKDKYEPIAFAGYSLISALNKLYCSKCAVR